MNSKPYHAILLLLALVLTVAACGDTGSGPAAASTPTPVVLSDPTSCLTGTWVAAKLIGKVQDQDGLQIQLEGGQGKTLTIDASGHWRDDYKDSLRFVGTYKQAEFTLTITGYLSGTLKTSGVQAGVPPVTASSGQVAFSLETNQAMVTTTYQGVSTDPTPFVDALQGTSYAYKCGVFAQPGFADSGGQRLLIDKDLYSKQ